MARSLTLHRATVPLRDKKQYMEQLRARRSHYLANGCNFWVFEEAGLHGAFLEFTEAPDEQTLRAAHLAMSDRVGDTARIYTEVELT